MSEQTGRGFRKLQAARDTIQAEDLSGYVPAFGWEMGLPSDKQRAILEKLGIFPDEIENAGKTKLLLDRMDKRRTKDLTLTKQIRFLEGRRFQHVSTWQFDAARTLIDQIATNGWQIPHGMIRYNKFRKMGTAGSKNREDKAAAVW